MMKVCSTTALLMTDWWVQPFAGSLVHEQAQAGATMVLLTCVLIQNFMRQLLLCFRPPLGFDGQ